MSGEITKYVEFYRATQDDWCPNFSCNTVRVRVYQLRSVWNTNDHWFARVCVWGAGDTGMEKDTSLAECKVKRQKQMADILRETNNLPNPLNRDWLSANGYTNA